MIFWLIALVMMADCEWGYPSFRNDLEVGRAALIPRGMDLLGLYSGAEALIPILVDLRLWLIAGVRLKKGGQAKPLRFLPNPSGASQDLCNQSALDAYLWCKKLKQ
jgi:hypothetical protein